MSAAEHTVWETLFRKGETLLTEIKGFPFLLLDVGKDAIQVRAPAENGRDVPLDYAHLDSLWESRASVRDRISASRSVKSALTSTVNQVWKDRTLREDRTNESQYWALVCERERRQFGPGLDVDSKATEGNPRLVSHLRRERAPALRAKKIEKVLADAGKLICEACEFNFAEKYPGLGDNFCEVHHNLPLAKGERVTRLTELAILCSNCHRMIHRTAPMDSLKAFRERLKI